MLQSVGYLPYTVYWAIKNIQLIAWNYECPECYKHSNMSVFLSPSSIEGPINNICLALLPARALCWKDTTTYGVTISVSEGLTFSNNLFHLLTNQRGCQVNCEGEGGLLGVLDDDVGFTDVLGYLVCFLRYSLGRKKTLSLVYVCAKDQISVSRHHMASDATQNNSYCPWRMQTLSLKGCISVVLFFIYW